MAFPLAFPTSLLTTGKPFIKALESAGALAVYAPLEGGFEGRFLRRLRSVGYKAVTLSSRGLGDPATYLTGVHGVRPPHLGKKTIGKEAAVGEVQFIVPILSYRLGELPAKARGVVIWLSEGVVLSSQELNYFINLTQADPKIKVVVEMGGDRQFSWKPLRDVLPG
jgi:NAD(P)H-quinone oxidoreductase subunit N